jgi:hypothetical protein
MPLGLLALCLLSPTTAATQDQPGTDLSREEQIVISKDAVTRIPILLEEFATGSGAAKEDTRLVYEVLSNDLDHARTPGLCTRSSPMTSTMPTSSRS